MLDVAWNANVLPEIRVIMSLASAAVRLAIQAELAKHVCSFD